MSAADGDYSIVAGKNQAAAAFSRWAVTSTASRPARKRRIAARSLFKEVLFGYIGDGIESKGRGRPACSFGDQAMKAAHGKINPAQANESRGRKLAL
ncbi:MAG TPA: hypothetical protein VJ396_07940 [Acidiferrobacterales bacterium]|nr:hypothetical protein [Acidiferrobacterales bacterium]